MFGHIPVAFDSAGLGEKERFAFAREEYGRKALKVDLELRGDTPFRLRMRADTFGDVRVAVIESTPYRVARTRSLIEDGDDRIGLVFPLTGSFTGEQDGRTITVAPGEATTMAAFRTGWFGTMSGGAFLTIRAAPALVRDHASDMARIRPGVGVKPSREGFNLIRSYLSALGRLEAGASPQLREIAGRHLVELATHAFGGAAPSGQDGEGVRTARTAAALAHIAAHFTDPGYGVAACAAHLGVSVRTVQLLLDEAGTSFGEEVKRLRLDHARGLLADPMSAGRRISDIALDCGYLDVSHFNRQFRERFGESPTSFRGS